MDNKIIQKFKKIVEPNSLIFLSTLICIEKVGYKLKIIANNIDTFVVFEDEVTYGGEDFSVSVNGKEFLAVVTKLKDLEYYVINEEFILKNKNNTVKLNRIVDTDGEDFRISYPELPKDETEYKAIDKGIWDKAIKFTGKEATTGRKISETVYLGKDGIYATDGYVICKLGIDSTNEVVIPVNFIKTGPDTISVTDDLVWDKQNDCTVISYISNEPEDFPIISLRNILSESFSASVLNIKPLQIIKILGIHKALKNDYLDLIAENGKLRIITVGGSIDSIIDGEVKEDFKVRLDTKLFEKILSVAKGELVDLMKHKDIVRLKHCRNEYALLRIRTVEEE